MSTDLFRKVAIILEEEDVSEGEEEEREAFRSGSASRTWAEREEGEGERESDQHVSDDDSEVVNRRSTSSPPLPALKRTLDDFTARSDPR